MKNIRNLLLVLMSIVILAIFTACGGGNVEPETAGGENKDNSNESQEPVKGGDLVVATPASPPSLDWGGQGATETKLIAWHIFEELFAFDEDYEIKPMLVDDYDVSDDGKTYTLNLRENVNFHDGSTMTTEDVLASLEHWKTTTQIGGETFEHIDEIKDPDEYTLEIHLKDEFPALLDNFANLNHALYIMPKEKAEEADGSLIDQEQAIGTGPYKFVDWDIGEQLTVERFDDYTSRDEEDWGGLTGKKTAYHDSITFKVVTDSQVEMNGVKSGEYDFALDITPDLYETLEQDDSIKTEIQEMNTFSTLLFNHSKSPFKDDKDLLHAVNHSLNKEEILSAAYGSEEFYEMDGSLFSQNMTDLYTDEGTDLYDAYDPEKAKELLEISDYDGETITMITTNDYADYEKIAQVAQQQMEDIGLNVEIETFEWGTFFDKWVEPENWDMVAITWPWYYSPLAVPIIAEDEHAGWHDLTTLFDLQDEWGATDDKEEQLDNVGELNEAIYEDMIWTKVGNSKALNISKAELQGYEDWDNVRFWNTWSSDE